MVSMKRIMVFAAGAAILTAPIAVGATTASPYAGQDSRDIKALSAQDVQRYLRGEGMGYAKAAELNHYPGPRHVLDLADQLNLSAEQRQRTQQIFDRMKAAALPLGQQIVSEERRLNSLFAASSIDQATLAAETAKIADLQGQLRDVHLSAHLATRAVLTQDQIVQYDRLRGYSAAGNPSMPAEHHHDM